MDENCNCHGNKTGKCNYDHMCRHRMIMLYENTCKNTGKCHIGNTSQHYKARMGQHNRQARLRLLKGEKYDSFAEHYAEQMQNFDPRKDRAFCKALKNSYTNRILWQGKSISTVKTFQTNHCMLCNQERLHIFKRSMENPSSLINFKRTALLAFKKLVKITEIPTALTFCY